MHEVKGKYTNQNQRIDMAMNGYGEAHGRIRQSTCSITEKTNALEYGSKKQDWSQFLEVGVKETADEGEYYNFSVLRKGFHHYCVTPFHHVKLCLFFVPLHNICYTIEPH